MDVDNRAIGVFDSGVGGLTVGRAIMNRLPSENMIYLGDTARVPYGPRSLEEVRGFVLEIVSYFEALGVKLIVIACNTGTAAGLAAAQEAFDLPIVGVIEPGAHGAIQATRSRRIGVIATDGTIGSNSYQSALKLLDAGVEVTARSCPPFVEYVERGETSGEEVRSVIEEHLAPIKRAAVDTLILGCTHYPLLAGEISQVMGDGVEIISSAAETALEVESILRRRGQLRGGAPKGTHRFLCTANPEQFLLLGSRFLGSPISSVELVETHRKDSGGQVRTVSADEGTVMKATESQTKLSASEARDILAAGESAWS